MNQYSTKYTNTQIINGVAFGFSTLFLLSSVIAAYYTGERGLILNHWWKIMTSPSPLVTDYLELGSLSSAMLNTGACGMACFLFMHFLKGDSTPNTLAGYFLVVAHCFYGLNFLNMWPCFIATLLFMKHRKQNLKDNLHICMFATSFAPFIGEFLFRYTLGDRFDLDHPQVTFAGILLAILFSVIVAFVIQPMLGGAKNWHKGYNLFNGGLAFGVFGMFATNILYKTIGIENPTPIVSYNEVYLAHERSYHLYANLFFLVAFGLLILSGYLLNHRSFHGYEELLSDTGHCSDFAAKYGMPLCLINIGLVGCLFLLYLNVIISLTPGGGFAGLPFSIVPGAGFTGPTIGVVLAAITFTSMGQHPRNVWPVLVGYILLFISAHTFSQLGSWDLPWSVSMQSYINAAAFATGLCPIAGRYGRRAGVLAGIVCAAMCTSTSSIHSGLVLYNGGFTAGITALILVPILEFYIPTYREKIKPISIHKRKS